MKTSAVRSLRGGEDRVDVGRALAARGTSTGVAPAASAPMRYIPKPCSVWMTSVPGPA